MNEWTAFDQIAGALTWIAVATWIALLKTFGFWRWLAGRPAVRWIWDRLLTWVARVT